MDRRSFLKACGLAVGAALVPIPDIGKYNNFNPKLQYGDYVYVTDRFDVNNPYDPIRQLVVGRLEEGVAETIPPEYRHKVGWIYGKGDSGSADPLMQRTTVGWKYTPEGYNDASV